MARRSNSRQSSELTLDEIRALLAPLIADSAAFDGWSEQAVAGAAAGVGIDPAVARLAFPGGAMDMIAAWIEHIDRAMAEALPAAMLAGMKMRERIRALVWFRICSIFGKEEALRRALAIQAMPQNAAATLRQGWHSADLMWRLAGDDASDFNHYTKRAILAALYGATLTVWVSDDSDGKADTQSFLDRRIDGVMKFEKAKAQLFKERDGFSVTRFLGRLRYPAR